MVYHIEFYIKVTFAEYLSTNQTIQANDIDGNDMLEKENEYEYIKPRFMEVRKFFNHSQ